MRIDSMVNQAKNRNIQNEFFILTYFEATLLINKTFYFLKHILLL